MTSVFFSFFQAYDYEYDHESKEESVLHDHAWGFCDPKCFVQKEDIVALDLQEVPFFALKYIRREKNNSGETLDPVGRGMQESNMDS